MKVPKFGYSVEERNIFLQSNLLKEKYPSVYQYMAANEQASEKSVELSTDNELALLLHRPNNHLTKLFEQAQNEWTIVTQGLFEEFREDVLKKTKCELCAQPHLRRIYKLKNTLNENCMEIGSTCYEKFDFDKNNADIDRRERVLDNIKRRANRSQREREIDTRSDSALFKIKTLEREWDRLPFLPSAEITNEYRLLYWSKVAPFITRITNKNTVITPEDIVKCRQYAEEMGQILSEAKADLEQESPVWRISRTVYYWAIEKDRKETNPHNSITRQLENTCYICSSNVAIIMEEGHKKECLARISKELPQGSSISVSNLQSDIITYLYIIGDREYAFEVMYKNLIHLLARMGFPAPGSIRAISKEDLSSMGAKAIIQEGTEGNEYLRNVLRKMGYIKKRETSDGGTMLISYTLKGQTYGKSIEVTSLRSEIADAILLKREEALLAKLHIKLSVGRLRPIDDAISDWNFIHGK